MSKTVKIIVPALIIAIVAAIFIKLSIIKNKKDVTMYSLTFDRIKSNATLPEAQKEQKVIIRLNGNPVRIFTGGATIIPLNFFMCPGQNKLELEGNIIYSFYTKVEKKKEKATSSELILEKSIPGIESGEKIEMVFNADIPYQLPNYKEYAVVPDENSVTRAQICSLLNDLYSKLSNHDVATSSQLIKSQRIKSQIAKEVEERKLINAGYPKEKIEEDKKNEIEQFASRAIKFGPFDSNSVKFVWGKQMVMVYSGYDKTVFKNAFLFTFTENGIESILPEITITYEDGKWMIR